MQEELVFQTRSFIYSPLNKKVTILIQDQNGPCMLIAIFNALVLKNKVKIQPGKYPASLVIDLIIGTCPQLIEYGDNLLSLLNGCSINPVFSSCNEFKEYPEFLKLLNIQMYHGMLPDPSTPSFDIVSNYDYESLEMKILDLESTTYLLNNNTENNQTTSNKMNTPSKEANLQLSREDQKLLMYLKEFHSRIQRQITNIGIEAIDSAMSNGDVVIFFRSSHFSVITKHMNRVFSLITADFFNGSNCIWETLPNESGDSKYFDQDFILSTLTMNDNSRKPLNNANNSNIQKNNNNIQYNINPYRPNANHNNQPPSNYYTQPNNNNHAPTKTQPQTTITKNNNNPPNTQPSIQSKKSSKKDKTSSKKKHHHKKGEDCQIF